MSETFDVVGVGAGPSNLGVAAALSEDPRAAALTAAFFDARDRFDWHPDMLLPSSTMQVSFLKDLSTQRDPTSRFTFLNYLRESGRLSAFINKKSFFPSRLEYIDYLDWAARSLSDVIHFGSRVVSVRISPDLQSSTVSIDQGGVIREVEASRVCLGVGSRPRVPEWFSDSLSPRVFHNSRLRSGLKSLELGKCDTANVAVVGQGQSAAEVVRHVLEEYPNATVSWFIRGYGIVPADSSPFANSVFDPEAVDDFFYAPEASRSELLSRHRFTNYSCVDPDLIDWLFSAVYEGRVAGGGRLTIYRGANVFSADLSRCGSRVELHWEDSLRSCRVSTEHEAVVCATGFDSPFPADLLAFSSGLVPGQFEIGRDYKVRTFLDDSLVELPLFVVGSTESRHGLSSGLLSNIAPRSQEIVSRICDEREDRVLQD